MIEVLDMADSPNASIMTRRWRIISWINLLDRYGGRAFGMTHARLHVVQQLFIRSPRRILQLDLAGALMTSATIGLLFATKIIDCGLPTWILISMAAVAFGFACLDAMGVFLASDPRPFLLAIAALNLAYCVFSIVICFVYFEQLNWIGEFYFSVEVAVVVLIAIWECFVFSTTDAKYQTKTTQEEKSGS